MSPSPRNRLRYGFFLVILSIPFLIPHITQAFSISNLIPSSLLSSIYCVTVGKWVNDSSCRTPVPDNPPVLNPTTSNLQTSVPINPPPYISTPNPPPQYFTTNPTTYITQPTTIIERIINEAGNSNFITTDFFNQQLSAIYDSLENAIEPLQNITTSDVPEGNNLYYTDSRVSSYLSASTTLTATTNYWTKTNNDLSYISGNVGIGTTSPGQKLSVGGDILGNNHIGSYFTATSSTATSTFAGNVTTGFSLPGFGGIYASQFSMAQGYSNGGTINASGNGSFARGYADYSFFDGAGNITASNYGSMASGYAGANSNIRSSGYGSTALGYTLFSDITASGNGSLAGGYSGLGAVTSTSDGSFAWGSNVNATASFATAIGTDFTNSTASTFKVGYSSTPTLTVTSAGIGIATTTFNNILDIYSTTKSAIGFSGASGSTYKWTIGEDVSNGGRFSIASSSALGTSDRLVIDGAGYVGIGTTSPYAKLSVVGPVVAEYFHATSTTATTTLRGNLVVGTGNLYSSNNSAVIGQGPTSGGNMTASGLGSLVVGHNTGGSFSTTMTASGIGSIVLGSLSTGFLTSESMTASGRGALAGGYQTGGSGLTASGDGSFAWGRSISASGSYSTAFGSGGFNNSISNSFMVGYSSIPTLTVTSAGIGIATTTFNNILDIYSTTKSAIGFSGASGSTYKWTIGEDVSNGGRFSIASSSALGTSDRLVIDGAGNVGIGTTSPYAKLSVVGPVVAEYFHATSTTATSTIAGGLIVGNAGDTNGLTVTGSLGSWKFQPNGITLEATRSGPNYIFASGASGALDFGTGGSTGRMYITNGGVVGIGVTNPTGNLEIYDNTNSGTLRLSRDAGLARGAIEFGRHNSGTFQPTSQIVGTSDTVSANNGYLSFLTANSSATIGEAMRILGNGNVGIGTTSPYAKLSVVGPVVAEYFNATSTVATTTFQGIVLAGSGGGVGVATTTPWRTLSVNGTVAINGLTTESGTGNVLCVKAGGEVVQDDSPVTACSGASSRRVKHDIEELDTAKSLDQILSMNPVSYVYNDDYTTDRSTHLGFIAEDIEAIEPFLVDNPTNGDLKGLKYAEFVAPIIGAIKELSKRIDLILSWFDGNKLRIKDDVCVDDVCISKEKFKALLLVSGADEKDKDEQKEQKDQDNQEEQKNQEENHDNNSHDNNSTTTPDVISTTTPETTEVVEEERVKEESVGGVTETPEVVGEEKNEDVTEEHAEEVQKKEESEPVEETQVSEEAPSETSP